MPKKKNENVVAIDVKPEQLDTHIFDYILEHKTTNGAEFTVRKFLNTAGQVRFCDMVRDIVFTGSIYSPALFDFAVKYATIFEYTDIVMPTDADSNDKLCEVLYDTGLYATVLSYVNIGQYDSLVEAAKEKIADINKVTDMVMFAENVARSIPLFDTLNALVEKLGKTIQKKIKDMKIDEESVTRALGVINNLANVDQKDIAKNIVEKVLANQEEDK